MDKNNLYWDGNYSDNMVVPSKRDPSYANPNNVPVGYAYRDAQTRELLVGEMPLNPDVYVTLQYGDIYKIPEGYHSGKSRVYAQPLADMTMGTATEDDIVFNKVAWVNGKRIVGTLSLSKNNMEATATEDDILTGKNAWVKGNLIEGKIPIISRLDRYLAAGESYEIPKGYHMGGMMVRAKGLAEQTPGTATENNIEEGVGAWVNGVYLTGKLKPISDTLQQATATANDIRNGKVAFINIGPVVGTMPEFLNLPDKKLNAGEGIVIPEGYHSGKQVVFANALFEQTPGNAKPGDIRKGMIAWVYGEKIVGEMEPIYAPDMPGSAEPFDISEGKTAWVNGKMVVGTSLYNSVTFTGRYDNKNSSNDPITITLGMHNWDYINSIDILIISNNDKILHEYHLDNYYSNGFEEFIENGVVKATIISETGSPKVTFTSFVADSYMKVYVNNFTMLQLIEE